MAIEKNKILGAIFELPAKQYCQSSPFTSKLGGQIGYHLNSTANFALYIYNVKSLYDEKKITQNSQKQFFFPLLLGAK